MKGGMKVFCYRAMAINVKKRLYERVAVPTESYGSEILSMRVAEKKRLNQIDMRYLMNMCGVTCIDRVRNEVARWRTGVTRES